MRKSKSPQRGGPGPPPMPSTTGIVGSTRCGTFCEFSVVNSSSNPVASVWPAPTPSAYSSASFDVHVFLPGSETAPTASRFIGIARPSSGSRKHGRRLGGLRHEVGDDLRELRRLPTHLIVRRGGSSPPPFSDPAAAAAAA